MPETQYQLPKDPTLLEAMHHLSVAVLSIEKAMPSLRALAKDQNLADFAVRDSVRAFEQIEDAMSNLMRLQDRQEGTNFASTAPKIILPR